MVLQDHLIQSYRYLAYQCELISAKFQNFNSDHEVCAEGTDIWSATGVISVDPFSFWAFNSFLKYAVQFFYQFIVIGRRLAILLIY